MFKNGQNIPLFSRIVTFVASKREKMENIYMIIAESTCKALKNLYNADLTADKIPLQQTRKDFTGDITLVVFPFLKMAKKKPGEVAEDIAVVLVKEIEYIIDYNVIKGFLNLCVSDKYWTSFLDQNYNNPGFGKKNDANDAPVVIEYSSPNTNKPLHLGHIRNNLLGWSIAEIHKANGNITKKVNLVNNRGIHICKSMLAWMKWGNESTPDSANKKGDHFVGDYYVMFEKKNKEEADKLVEQGIPKDEAPMQTQLMKQARELLIKWENGEDKVVELWEKMNSWAMQGFELTYNRMGVDFDNIDLESKTYLHGKKLIEEGLEKGIFYKKDDGSVWVSLKKEGLDEKLLLRADGTSVYITQDLGTAQLRHDEYNPSKMIYVVGNEQEYHFNVLKIILKKLGRNWADKITHFSYGMVRLPEGKMKSREGKVVDADDLMDEMFKTAAETTEELGKTGDFNEEEKQTLYNTISLGALKYFILKVDPKKEMLFNPKESIDFNGNTGPFIQYTHARICSVLKKARDKNIEFDTNYNNQNITLEEKEKELVKALHQYPAINEEAAKETSPAEIANYIYEIAKQYNHFYQSVPILKQQEVVSLQMVMRLRLSEFTANVIKSGMGLLGVEVPQKM